jgi:hypothetical protein
MEIAFADGYVAPISGPIMMETNDGYAVKDPGNRRALVAFALPAAGAGIGALIGYAAGSAGSTQSTTLPPGCIGGPPFCLSMSTPVLGTKRQGCDYRSRCRGGHWSFGLDGPAVQLAQFLH